ncbi:MAG: sugar ABC transporter substrate-binding protein [Treponema sp.]|nr:sugar ABC transporter substrate-binding protein [Treponema sp.]
MRKIFCTVLVLALCTGLFFSCQRTSRAANVSLGEVVEYASHAARLRAYGLDANRRFIGEPRTITVTTWDRRNDGGSDPTNNAFTDFIKEGMLRDHNVRVQFVALYRWNEVEEMNNLLAANDAPDVGITFNYPTIENYGYQEAVWDLHPFIDKSEQLFPNLWNTLGRSYLYWNQDPQTGHIWSIMGKQAFNQRTITFIREDWLTTLNLPIPRTLQEFENALAAFRSNARILLGNDAAHMAPLHMTQDIGWVAMPLIESFLPNSITDRDLFIYDVGGPRNFFRPGAKEAIRILNKWYHMGLLDPDFALYGTGNDTPTNQIRAGFVGAMMHSWDQPYRGGDQGDTAHMQRARGPRANFIAVNAFQNDAGHYRKYLGTGVDRNMFLPATNKEPVASLLYLDWISKLENRRVLQIGWQGINHEVMPDGAIRNIPAESPHIMNSGMNYDLTMTINGLDLGDLSLTARSRALGYSGIEGRLIERAVEVQSTDVRVLGQISVGAITSEEGMADTIRERASAAWARAIVAPAADFDRVYDAEFDVLMRQFASENIAERTRLWQEFYGNAAMLP